MEADAMDFSLLFTGINGYYARLGYSDLAAAFFSGRIRAAFVPLQTPYRVRPAVGSDLPAVFGIYNAYNATRPIAVQRSEAYWRDWIGIAPDKTPPNMRIAEDASGRIAGYIRTGHFNSAIPYNANEIEARIIEFGSLPIDSEEIAGALLDSIAQELRAAGATRLQAAVPKEPALACNLERILETVERKESGSGMLRLLHRTNLLQSLTFEMNDRWAQAGRPQGRIAFQTPYGATAIDATGAFLKVEASAEAEATLSQSDLFGALFGAKPLEALSVDPAAQEILTVLFPKRNPIYWGADGF
jgi:hypothetical protein